MKVPPVISVPNDPFPLNGESAAIGRLREQIDVAATSDEPVLLVGMAGTGKKVVARAIHARSRRAARPLAILDCGAMDPEMMGSELLGYVAGAFNTRYPFAGRLRAAARSSIFLDQIAMLSVNLQAALLRAIECGEVQPVGGHEPIREVDVRYIGAIDSLSNRLCDRDVGLKWDLFCRLAENVVEVPPLCERREDMPELAQHVLKEVCVEHRRKKYLSGAALDELTQCAFPFGNLRALRQTIRNSFLACDEEIIRPQHLRNRYGRPFIIMPARAPVVSTSNAPTAVSRQRQRPEGNTHGNAHGVSSSRAPLTQDSVIKAGCNASFSIPFAAILLAVSSIVSAAACTPAESGPATRNGIRHPQIDYLDRPPHVPIMRVDRRPNHVEALAEASRALRDIQLVASIGTLDGVPSSVFGKVEDVHIDADGRLYVLDSRFNELRLYTKDGDLLSVVGGSGVGPRYLVQPTALAVDEKRRRVYVLEANYEVEVFLRDGATLAHAETLRTAILQKAACMLDGNLFVNARPVDPKSPLRLDGILMHSALPNRGESMLHEFDGEGSLLGSFGSVYRSPNRRVNSRFAEGLVECDPVEGLILFGTKTLVGELRAYWPDGKLAWIAAVEPFVPHDYIEAGQRLSVGFPQQGFNRLESLTRLPDATILYQVGMSVRDGADARKFPTYTRELHTYAFLSSTGDGAYLGSDLPKIVAANDSFLVMQEEDTTGPLPFPKLEIYSYRAGS